MRRAVAVAGSLIVVMAACGGSGSEPPSATRLETTFDVTTHEDVVILDEQTVEDRLVSFDPAAGEYRFRGAMDEVHELDVGSPVVIDGAGFGIVRAVVDDAGDTVLQVGEATLGDVIETGTMKWDYDISWADFEVIFEESTDLSSVAPRQFPEGRFVVAAPRSDGLLAFSGRQATSGGRYAAAEAQESRKTTIEFAHQGWKFTLDLEPKDEKLHFGIAGSFSVGNTVAQASISGKGWISGFNYSSVLEYDGGAPSNMSAEINGLHGEMELQWAAFRTPQQALSELVRFSVPLTLPIPLPGPVGIPLMLQMKMAGRIVPELSALEASSGGTWKVTYSSDQGFNVDNEGGGLPVGALKSEAIDTAGETVTAGHGPAGFGLGLEFPRFELGFAGLDPFAFVTLDMYSTSLWTPGTLLTGDIPPCQYGYTKLAAIAGYKLKVLGWAGLSDQYTLWEKQVDKYLDGKRCTLSGE